MKLAMYRILTTVGLPLIRLYLSRRLARGKEDPARFGERQGVASRPRPDGLLVWMHGASVGEALSMLPVIEWIQANRKDIRVLVTTGTVTSANLLAGRLPDGVVHQYIPVDRIPWVRRFLDHWQPDHVLWFESELWPNLLIETADRGIDLTLINGRMSAVSFEKWSHHPGLARKLLHCFGLCLGQTDADTRRFEELGAPEAKTSGNLKLAAAPLPADEGALEALRAAAGERPIWLASSTHAGEEEMAARVHRRVREKHSRVLTVIVPRHPHRGEEIAREIAVTDLNVIRRGEVGALPKPDTDVYVADTVGELGLFYRLANIVFIGKSILSKGGQNPIEPAHFSKPVLFGPNMQNFEELSDRMLRKGAAMQVDDESSLAEALNELMADDVEYRRLGDAAKAFSVAEASVLEPIMGMIAARLPQAPTRKEGA